MADDPLRNLKALRHKVDAHASWVMTERAASFACRAGCDACCQTERSVTDVEYAALEAAVAGLDAETLGKLRAREGDACSLLLDGRCAVYADRPIICRSHGLPLVMSGQLDVCPLNFEGEALEELPQADVLSVDTVTAILVTLNQLFCSETGGDAGRRRRVGGVLRVTQGE
ncbi:MAG: YkgJ family cysteine cluster protein [Alphaproteobacteria bacterium]|nr:YkgJ family cysteine cluster protein [Alphaproteobacteria bacterium]